jgi:hypothetical protein
MIPDLMAQVKRVRARWGTVLAATAFTLLFEYSIRGITDLARHPLLLPVLAAAYLSYFTMVEDLIGRFKIRERHLMAVAFFAGTVYAFLVSGLAVTPPLLLGVNWVAILFVTLVWWGPLQTILALYLGGRVLPRTDDRTPLTLPAWGFALAVQGAVILIFQASGLVQGITAAGAGMMVLLLLLCSAVAVKMPLPPRGVPVLATAPDPVYDLLAGASVILFLACAILLTGDPVRSGASTVNRTAVQVVVLWSLAVAAVMALHRLVRWSSRRMRADPLNP